MKNSFLIIFVSLAVLLMPCYALADSARTIVLKDGSQLKGNVIAFANGVYTIETLHLGQVQIHEDKIVSITSQGYAAQNPTPKTVQQEMLNMQQNLMSDPDIANDIMNLSQDEEILNLMNDPELMNDIMNFNTEKLQNNPKLQQLMQNPKMQQIMNKASQKIPATLPSSVSPSVSQ